MASARYTWAETYARSRRLASALARRGFGKGDTIAVMLANTPEMIEANFGVPMMGGVLNTLNTRLDAEAIAFMLEHGEAKVLLTDTEFAPVVAKALAALAAKPLVIDIVDFSGPGGELLGETDYEAFLAEGDPEFAWAPPADEWDAISLNYTSGTTGNPKGVVYHHRGAYLNALSNIIDWSMPRHAVYLWTLPLFHCNGWCFAWTMAANAGTNVCLRRVEAQGDLRRDPRAQGHALLRRADRAFAAHQRAGGDEARDRAQGARAGRRRRAARGDDRGRRTDGLRHHARLRPDRGRTDRRRCAPSIRSGTRWTSARARSATAGRACATRARKA